MFRRIARGWAFAKVSWSVLSRHPKLVILPIFSTAAILLIFGFIAASVFWDGTDKSMPSLFRLMDTGQIVLYPILFIFYFVNMFIVIFFNAALVFCTLEAFAGKTPSVMTGLAAAGQRLPQILAWTFVASTVGVILNMLESMLERTLGFLGSLIGASFEIGWTVATYLVVPVLVIDGVGPIDAVKRSSAALKRSWGDSATGEGGFTVISFLFIVPAYLLLTHVGSPIVWVFPFGFILFALYALAVSVIFAALSIIFRTGVYVYATTGTVPHGFDARVLVVPSAEKPEPRGRIPASVPGLFRDAKCYRRKAGLLGFGGWGRPAGLRTCPKHRDHCLHTQASSASPKTWQTLICPLMQNGFGRQ